MGTVAIGTVFISNGWSVGSFKYAANALSRPTIETLSARQKFNYEQTKKVVYVYSLCQDG